LRIDYPESTGIAVIFVWLLFPTAFFLIAVYPTSLFITLAVASFYFARRGNWKCAGLFSATATLARPYGIFLAPAMLFEYLSFKKFKFRESVKDYQWLFLLLPAVTLLGFEIFIWSKSGDAFFFLKNETFWGKVFVWPHHVFLGYAHEVLHLNIFSKNNIHFLIDLFAILYFILASALSIINKVRWSYIIFPVLSFGLVMFGGNFVSSGRYLLEMPFIFIGPAIFLARKKNIFHLYAFVSFGLLLLFAALFTSWFPIY